MEQLRDKNIVLVSSKRFPHLIQQRFATVLLSKKIEVENEHFALIDRKAIEDNMPKKFSLSRLLLSQRKKGAEKRIKPI